MATHWLSKHVHLCATADHLVLLDLRNDRYLALPTAHARTLGRYVAGWPIGSNEGATDDSAASLLSSLEERNILTREVTLGKSAAVEATVPAPNALIDTILLYTLDPSVPPPPKVSVTDVIRFTLSYVLARRTLSTNALAKRVAKMRRRKSKATLVCNDLQDLRQRITSFRLIRPFFYTSDNKCLLDALVLTEYLARYRHFPSWVFGVQTRPFAAHCWVQTNDFVLNDIPEHVDTFTTIMSV